MGVNFANMDKRRTDEMISHSCKFYQAIELRMPEHFTRHTLFPQVFPINGDFFCLGVYVDDSRGEATLEFLCEVGRNGLFDDDFGENAV